MKTVKQISQISGITVRTLHYYDEISLLSPTLIKENGYRFYDEAALGKLQEILFFRELGFALKDIKKIMENPNYDRAIALNNHIKLLEMKKQKLAELIILANDALKGENTMEFKAFDDKNIKATQTQYQEEVEQRWGDTEAYAESEDKTEHYTEAQWQVIRGEMDDLMASFSKEIGTNPSSARVQDLVRQWQDHLTKYYYEATNEMLKSLGQMYVEDERFTANIDKYGKGTAQLLSQAIAIYTK